MPQLEFATYSSQIFWLIICLAVLYFSLRYFFIPRFETSLQTRQAKLAKLAADTNVIKEEIVKLQASYEQAIKEANATTIRLQQEQLDKFKHNCKQQLNTLNSAQQEELKQAEADIEKIKKNFESSIPTEIEKLLRNFVAKLEKGEEGK